MNHMGFVLACAFLLLGKEIVGQSCYTPDGQQGQCVPLNECPKVFDIFADPPRGSETYLRQFLCNEVKQLKVCCGTSTNFTLLEDDLRPDNIVPDLLNRKAFDYCSQNSLPDIDLGVILRSGDSNVEGKRCLGILANPRYVITPAQCVVSNTQGQQFSVVGVKFRGINNNSPTFGIDEVICHPFFDPVTGTNDIALLRLDQIVSEDPCTTPNGEIGECRYLSHCPALLDAFSSVTNATEAYLRGFICEAREEGFPVCCVTSSNSTIVLKKDEPKLVDVPIQFLETRLCGLQHRDDYFSSSTAIAIDEFPWIAIIGTENEFLAPCAGALINSRYVISTGFCVVHRYIDTTYVQFGNYNQFNETSCVKDPDIDATDCTETEKYDVEDIILHPFYLRNLNNIGLLRLNKTVTYTDFIRPICLPIPGTVTPKVDDTMYWSGWGFHDDDSKRGIKKKVLTQLIHEEECRQQFPAYSNIKHWNIICTLDYENNTNTASIFEQGGPLMFDNNYKWYIAGLVWLPTRKHVPNSYVNVLKYINWIIDRMEPW